MQGSIDAIFVANMEYCPPYSEINAVSLLPSPTHHHLSRALRSCSTHVPSHAVGDAVAVNTPPVIVISSVEKTIVVAMELPAALCGLWLGGGAALTLAGDGGGLLADGPAGGVVGIDAEAELAEVTRVLGGTLDEAPAGLLGRILGELPAGMLAGALDGLAAGLLAGTLDGLAAGLLAGTLDALTAGLLAGTLDGLVPGPAGPGAASDCWKYKV
jgi:hypothetical protein